MRGRKPTAATLALPHADQAPRAGLAIPAPPPELAGESLEEWHRVTRLLKRLGIIARLDAAPLAIYCRAYARWRKAEREIDAAGEVVKSPNGYPIQNPWLAVAAGAAKQVQLLLGEFGLSPAARHRLLGPPKKKSKAAKSRWEGLIAS